MRAFELRAVFVDARRDAAVDGVEGHTAIVASSTA
jgi:hypothetical protein